MSEESHRAVDQEGATESPMASGDRRGERGEGAVASRNEGGGSGQSPQPLGGRPGPRGWILITGGAMVVGWLLLLIGLFGAGGGLALVGLLVMVVASTWWNWKTRPEPAPAETAESQDRGSAGRAAAGAVAGAFADKQRQVEEEKAAARAREEARRRGEIVPGDPGPFGMNRPSATENLLKRAAGSERHKEWSKRNRRAVYRFVWRTTKGFFTPLIASVRELGRARSA